MDDFFPPNLYIYIYYKKKKKLNKSSFKIEMLISITVCTLHNKYKLKYNFTSIKCPQCL